MTTYMARGFRPDPESDRYWSYEDLLKPKMLIRTTGDVDLRPFTSPRHNQGSTGSCVANATVKALEIKRIQKYGREAHVDLSRLAVYYLARELMLPSETHLDDGTNIGLAFDVLRRFGVCPEADWPFDTAKLTTPPSWKAMRNAYQNKIQAFYRIRSTGNNRVDEVIRCLQAGNPVVFGTVVGSNWFNYQKGQVLKLPDKVEGSHATVIVGFENGLFIGENSWGSGWGNDGFYFMAPEVLSSDKSRDFWVPQAGWEPQAIAGFPW